MVKLSKSNILQLCTSYNETLSSTYHRLLGMLDERYYKEYCEQCGGLAYTSLEQSTVRELIMEKLIPN